MPPSLPIQLPTSLGNYPRPTAMIQQMFERAEDVVLQSYPIKDVPLRLRPLMVFFTAAWLILLGVLGFARLPELPINDKALHFFGIGFATFLLYFVLEVPDGPGRRVWYINRAPLIFTLVFGFFVGGIVSEIVQSFLPWKNFQWGDIAANLLGSTLFLYLAILLRKRARRRAEISELYQPLSAHEGASYRDAQGRTHAFGSAAAAGAAGVGAISLAEADEYEVSRHDVWDDEVDEEELVGNVFSIGDGDADDIV